MKRSFSIKKKSKTTEDIIKHFVGKTKVEVRVKYYNCLVHNWHNI